MADSDKFGALGERARVTGGGKNGNGRAHDMPTAETSSAAAPAALPCPQTGSTAQAVLSQDQILAQMLGPEPADKPVTISADALIIALYTAVAARLKEPLAALVTAIRSAAKSAAPWSIKDRVESQNKAQIKRLVTLPDPFASLLASLVLSIIELDQILANNFTPREYRDVMDGVVDRKILLVSLTGQGSKRERTWEYRSRTYAVNTDLRGIPEWKILADKLDELHLKVGPLLVTEAEERSKEQAAVKSAALVVDTDTTKEKPTITERSGALSLSKLLEGNLGVSRWVKVGGGSMRLHVFTDPKGRAVVGVEVHGRHKAFNQIPGSIGVKVQAVTEALKSGEDPDFTWATKVGKKFEADLRVVWPWVRDAIAVLKAREAADAAEEKAAIALAAKAKEAPPVVENAGTAPAPEVADVNEEPTPTVEVHGQDLAPVGRVPLGDPDTTPETPAAVQ